LFLYNDRPLLPSPTQLCLLLLNRIFLGIDFFGFLGAFDRSKIDCGGGSFVGGISNES